MKLKLRGNKDFGAPVCSDTVRGKNSTEPATASDLDLNFSFCKSQIRVFATKFSASQRQNFNLCGS
ncbi:hypothetical protein [uncultured Campylobacter sp.]|uniref:hypothetical protein n=1 Tax=uncultured Campylobacter sp. TaxID=218934 RepID=UPI00262AD95D|nr:hypothetical protein [uncultured Campylobacter sp.]